MNDIYDIRLLHFIINLFTEYLLFMAAGNRHNRMVIYDHSVIINLFYRFLGCRGDKKQGGLWVLDEIRFYGFRMPSLRIRARKVPRSSPRISAALFFPPTFHRVFSSVWRI